MKKIFNLTVFCIIMFAACASGDKQSSAGGTSLDAAINDAASYFSDRLPQGAKVALIHPDAPTGKLADYIFEELWGRFEDADKFVMVDRRNLDRIETEIKYQLGSGRVDDNMLASITKQYGADYLVHGQITLMGNEYRITFYATDVEKASSNQRVFNVKPDNRFTTLLNASADDEVERAIAVMARAVNERTTIAIGRISYADTQTVSNFSGWLKNSIVSNAQKQQDKFRIATDSQSADFAVASRGLTVVTPVANNPIQAVITGTYSPLDSGAEVIMQLTSTSGNKELLSSARFFISASELERRRLSLLPEKGGAVITLVEFETNQQAVNTYTGGNNKWNFTVTPDVLDGIYRDGDYMSMQIYSERDCYFRITHVDSNGKVQVIYPHDPSDNTFIRAGQTRRIPDNSGFRMTPPFGGEEMILVAAYDQPFTFTQPVDGLLSTESISRGLTVVNNNRTEITPSVAHKFSFTVLPR